MNETPTSQQRIRLRVTEKKHVAEGVVELVLADPAGMDLPAWEPGAHIGLCMDEKLVRQYSLCGEVGDRSHYRIAVLREEHGRGGSVFVHDRLGVGDDIEVMPPRNNFELHPAPSYLFIAGGIGITPLIPMLAAAARAGADWRLAYGGRTRSSMAFVHELTTAYPGRVEVYREDVDGLLPIERLLKDLDPETRVYCCGPEGLLTAVEQECAERSIARLHTERFTAADNDADHENTAFEVVLAQSGVTLEVPADRSILDVIEEAGIPVNSSCREGTCATCETFVLEGACDHRDSLLTEAERESGESMMICVSRARGERLVLDL